MSHYILTSVIKKTSTSVSIQFQMCMHIDTATYLSVQQPGS